MVDIGQFDSRLNMVAADLKIAIDNLEKITMQAATGSEEDTHRFYHATDIHDKIFELRAATEQYLDE